MDYYNLDSEVIETLDFLRPPVQRNYRHINREGAHNAEHVNRQNNVHLLRDFRTKPTNHIETCEEVDVVSSTSLVLKKTTEREFLEKFSVLSHTNLEHSDQNIGLTNKYKQPNKDRPIIKVTVIPNSTVQTQKKFRKRRTPNRVLSTTSNHENSIKAKNVYLVVAGRKKEKIYEIKTAGSAEFPNQTFVKDELVSVDQVNNFKQLISSLNMDKKKKKGKKKDEPKKSSKTSLINEVFENADIFLPEYSGNDAAKDLNTRKSRVRITGRIGLTEDDKYVLRCAATIDDKPVPTNMANIVFDRNDINNEQQSGNSKNFRNQKDSNIQADFQYGKMGTPAMVNCLCKETQFSPSNFNTVCFSNIETLKIFSKNENSPHMSEFESDFDSPQNCSSPLVIISVYPKKDSTEKLKTEKSVNKDNRNRSPQKTNNPNAKVRGKIKIDNNSAKNENRSPRTRSPSPSPSPSGRVLFKRGDHNQPEPRSPRTKPTKEGTYGQPTIVNTVNKMQQTRDKIIPNPKTKPPSNKNTPQMRHGIQNKKQQNLNNIKSQESKGTNTDHMLTKKALVDTYTKKITEQMNQKKPTKKGMPAPKSHVSNISVNIDGEHEFYDLLFRQGDLTTDLRVRKTVREQGSQKSYPADDASSPSMENFFLVPEGPTARKRSFSQTFLLDDPTNADNTLESLSRINVRDSIEISHRREERSSDGKKVTKTDITYVNSKDRFTNQEKHSVAHLKHYIGDDCPISDPVQRDKEIRELLGLEKPRATTTKPRVEQVSANDGELPVHYFYHINNEEMIAEIEDSITSFYNLTPPCQCMDMSDTVTNKPDIKNLKTNTIQSGNKQRQELRELTSESNEQSLEQSSGENQQIGHNKNLEVHSQLNQASVHQSYEPAPHASTKQPLQQTPLYQQLILNRNINVYLQIEQFTKQKPIVLSRKQYDKVKKTIENTNLKRPKMCICKKYSSFTLGQVRKKENGTILHYNKFVQTDAESKSHRHKKKEKSIKECTKKQSNKKPIVDKQDKGDSSGTCVCKCESGDKKKVESSNAEKEQKVADCCKFCVPNTSAQNTYLSKKNSGNWNTDTVCCRYCGQIQSSQNNYCCNCGMYQNHNTNQLYFNTVEDRSGSSRNENIRSSPRQAASSMEIHYTSVAYTKHVTFSSTNFGAPTQSVSNLKSIKKNVSHSDSILTLFKGHRKTPTPNLGTSVYSLYSDYTEKSPKQTLEDKPRKPFLRRLMSCLVMRSTRTSGVKLTVPVPNQVSVNSSVDSYHISTSLGAIELTSSIYDTSGSFYSNHTILPINTKMKRGFLSSMRGFLTSRKS